MTEIQEFCDSIRGRVDTANFGEKRQLLELFDVRGKLTLCRLTPSLPKLAPTSPSLSCYNGTQFFVTARLVLPKYKGRQGQIYENNYVSSMEGA
jgi:hypothetical protein